MLEKIIVGVSCISAILGSTGCSNNNFLERYDVKANVRAGTFDTQGKTSESTTHKVMMGVGLSIAEKKEEFKKQISFEYNTQAEPPDEDLQSIHDTKEISAEISHPIQFFKHTFYPSIGAGFKNLRRNSSETSWGDLNFAEANLGIGTNIDGIYLKAGSSIPFYTNTDIGDNPKGKLGFKVSAEIPISERFSVKPFYETTSFEDNTNGFKFELYGVGLVYKLKP